MTPACAVLGVSRSAYYQWSTQAPARRRQQDAALGERIEGIHRESRGTYGAPRVQSQLHREGVACGKKRVARLMAVRGLTGRRRRRSQRTTRADPAAQPVAADLVQRAFTTSGTLNRVWVSDITYLRTWEAGVIWPPLSTSPAGGWWASPSLTTCGRVWWSRR